MPFYGSVFTSLSIPQTLLYGKGGDVVCHKFLGDSKTENCQMALNKVVLSTTYHKM